MSSESAELSNDLRRLVGQRVRVAGKATFGTHTGNQHAPLLLSITHIASASNPTEAYGTARTTVQAFFSRAGSLERR